MSMGLGESSGGELQRWRARCPFLQKLAFTLPIFGETGMDFVRGNRGRKEQAHFPGDCYRALHETAPKTSSVL